MDKFLKGYLKRASEIIGERSPGEILHDHAVVEALNQGRSIEEALATAASKYPDEALGWDATTIGDIAAHYDYVREHMGMLEKIQKAKR